MDRLLKLVHSKAAEERLVEVISSPSTDTNVEKLIHETKTDKNEGKVSCETKTDKNDTKAIRETENDKNEEKVISSKEENDVKVKDKIEKEAVEIDKGIETNQITESGEKFETFGEAGSSEKKESKANAKTNAENKKEETKAKIETDADKSKAKTNVNRQPIVMKPNTERKTEKTKSCIGKNETGEDTGDATDVCDSDDLFEEEERSRVVKRAGSTGQQDFFEKAYPILYEPLTSCSSIYDPSQGSSNDPFHPGFGGKPTSSVGSSNIPDLSEITRCEGADGEARGKGFKRLKDYLKRNRDFQEYSDYIFVENMCKAEDESPAATPTSLKVSFCIFNKIFLIPILPHTCCIFYFRAIFMAKL